MSDDITRLKAAVARVFGSPGIEHPRVTEAEHSRWLLKVSYGLIPAYTGTSKPPRGYLKHLRLDYRKIRKQERRRAWAGHGND